MTWIVIVTSASTHALHGTLDTDCTNTENGPQVIMGTFEICVLRAFPPYRTPTTHSNAVTTALYLKPLTTFWAIFTLRLVLQQQPR